MTLLGSFSGPNKLFCGSLENIKAQPSINVRWSDKSAFGKTPLLVGPLNTVWSMVGNRVAELDQYD